MLFRRRFKPALLFCVFIFNFLFYMSGCLVCTSHAHPVPAKARRDTGVRDSGELLHGCWKSNPGPGRAASVLSTVEHLSLHLFPDRWQDGVVDVKHSLFALDWF